MCSPAVLELPKMSGYLDKGFQRGVNPKDTKKEKNGIMKFNSQTGLSLSWAWARVFVEILEIFKIQRQ